MTLFLALAVLSCLCAAPALAQDADEMFSDPGRGAWSFAAGAETDNRDWDISKSGGDPSAWGLVEWSGAAGLYYAETGLETISGETGADLEAHLGFGLRPQVAGFDLDLNTTHKWEIDAEGGDDDSWEFTAQASRSIGPASARLRVQYSPNGLGVVERWTWVEAQAGWAVSDNLELSAAVGRREQDRDLDYTGWNVGLTYALTRDLELDLRYHDTDADVPGDRFQDALVAGISVYF